MQYWFIKASISDNVDDPKNVTEGKKILMRPITCEPRKVASCVHIDAGSCSQELHSVEKLESLSAIISDDEAVVGDCVPCCSGLLSVEK